MSERIAFIGLGVMGAPMARHLAAKYDVTVFDVDAAKMATIAGAKHARGAAEAAGDLISPACLSQDRKSSRTLFWARTGSRMR